MVYAKARVAGMSDLCVPAFPWASPPTAVPASSLLSPIIYKSGEDDTAFGSRIVHSHFAQPRKLLNVM